MFSGYPLFVIIDFTKAKSDTGCVDEVMCCLEYFNINGSSRTALELCAALRP